MVYVLHFLNFGYTAGNWIDLKWAFFLSYFFVLYSFNLSLNCDMFAHNSCVYVHFREIIQVKPSKSISVRSMAILLHFSNNLSLVSLLKYVVLLTVIKKCELSCLASYIMHPANDSLNTGK